jgi:hypothetical protein
VVNAAAPSFHDSKQRAVELLEDLSRMRSTSCDEDPVVLKNTANLLSERARALIYREDRIFVSKLIETSQIVRFAIWLFHMLST